MEVRNSQSSDNYQSSPHQAGAIAADEPAVECSTVTACDPDPGDTFPDHFPPAQDDSRTRGDHTDVITNFSKENDVPASVARDEETEVHSKENSSPEVLKNQAADDGPSNLSATPNLPFSTNQATDDTKASSTRDLPPTAADADDTSSTNTSSFTAVFPTEHQGGNEASPRNASELPPTAPQAADADETSPTNKSPYPATEHQADNEASSMNGDLSPPAPQVADADETTDLTNMPPHPERSSAANQAAAEPSPTSMSPALEGNPSSPRLSGSSSPSSPRPGTPGDVAWWRDQGLSLPVPEMLSKLFSEVWLYPSGS